MTQAIRLMQSPAFLGAHKLTKVSEEYVTRYDLKELTSKGMGHMITWVQIFHGESRPDCCKYGAPGFSELMSSVTIGTWGESETLDSILLDWNRVPSLRQYPVKIDTHVWSPYKKNFIEPGESCDHKLAERYHSGIRRKLYKIVRGILEDTPGFSRP